MAKRTHESIMRTFTDMIREMPFDRITVSELVRRCGISPNTFYYHYGDIHELLNSWLNEGVNRFVRISGAMSDWSKVLKDVLRLLRDNYISTYHIYNSLSRDALERFAFKQSEDLITMTIRDIAGRFDYEVPEDRLSILKDNINFMFFGFLLHFIWDKMNDDIDRSVDTFAEMVEDLVMVTVSKFPKKRRA